MGVSDSLLGTNRFWGLGIAVAAVAAYSLAAVSVGPGALDSDTLSHSKKAIEYYEKSLELNPDNTNAVGMLEKIRSAGN